MPELSTKPYLLRAIHEWCSDSGLTPYIAVSVDEHTRVPPEFVQDGEIVLNISMTATNNLLIDQDWIEFQARFNGRVRELLIPIGNVSAIYARENGHGMAFEVERAAPSSAPAADERVSTLRSVSVDDSDAHAPAEGGADDIDAPGEPPRRSRGSRGRRRGDGPRLRAVPPSGGEPGAGQGESASIQGAVDAGGDRGGPDEAGAGDDLSLPSEDRSQDDAPGAGDRPSPVSQEVHTPSDPTAADVTAADPTAADAKAADAKADSPTGKSARRPARKGKGPAASAEAAAEPPRSAQAASEAEAAKLAPTDRGDVSSDPHSDDEPPPAGTRRKGRPTLTRVK
ncbi:MAG: ClpXP protease specificity-enhancing factor [Burkholderiaceae bacterium]